ncbi:hypothetical protein E5288_WYG016994 [Bos mutus]|uniref:Uncharacterized protein n=1 Tax=Bos mutus TaxID=72004 RepID=A0A6B0RFU4_9CETA|nr:hypothetical protein [Bos mutus]
MRCSQGLRISARTLRRLGRCSQQLLQGALSVSPREAGILKVPKLWHRNWTPHPHRHLHTGRCSMLSPSGTSFEEKAGLAIKVVECGKENFLKKLIL